MRLVLPVLMVAAAACSSGSGHAAATAAVSPGGYLGSLGTASCKTAPAFRSMQGAPEVGFDSPRGSLWALFFQPVPPPTGQDIKVVWRMTGSGDFVFRVTDTDGKVIPLAWGPEAHLGSSWNHPGSEVGTGFNFPHAGCWQIHVARATTSGDMWLEVATR